MFGTRIPFFQLQGRIGVKILNWTWYVALDYVSLLSIHSLQWWQWRATAGLTSIWHVAAVVGADGEPKAGRAHDGQLGPHHARCSGRSRHGGLAIFQVNGGIMRRGDRRYENIILANYSPASLVLSKILWSKKYKGSTPLKNYSFKYLQKQLYYSIWTNSSVKALVNSDTRIPPQICIIHPASRLSYSILNGTKYHFPIYMFLLKGS